MHTLTVEPGSFADGKTITDLNMKVRYGIAPDATTKLQAGDALMVLTTDIAVQEIAELFSHSRG
jgi:K+/H+ antiporter YhaU regulatory subunit KhtT